MNKLAIKLEQEGRLLELKPMETLKEFGFNSGMTFCDIGAGTGVFSFEAATISKADTYALEISDEMLEIIKKKIEIGNYFNVHAKKILKNRFELVSKSIDFILLSTVFHEILEKERAALFSEIRRVLKDNGKFLVIEFLKKETSMGPSSIERKISREEMVKIAEKYKFVETKHKILGNNLYAVEFEKLR